MARGEGRSKKGEVLVAILNDPSAWRIARDQGWYRIPVESKPRAWPPQWIAFYQTKVFQEEAYAVRYFAKVKGIEVATRRELLPDEPSGPKSERQYYKVMLEKIEELPEPVLSLRRRMIVFIPTTKYQLDTANEINDLYGESPLEEAMWRALKERKIKAERQYEIKHEGHWYMLDFAVFCKQGKVNIETDGDTWHAVKSRIPLDNERNNALASDGWTVLRFNGDQVREKMAEYCVPKIRRTIDKLGGLDDSPGPLPPEPDTQLNLFVD